MKSAILAKLQEVAASLNIPASAVKLDYPESFEHGDFTTNVALVAAKNVKMPPKSLAEKIVADFKEKIPECVAEIYIAGPGFINIRLKDEFIAHEILNTAANSEYGISKEHTGEKVMVEYTDPNPFKVFHIGHLMSNSIGESISRLVQFGGATVIRANWQGDVGVHVAKAIWAVLKKKIVREQHTDLDALEFWGQAYVIGNEAYETDEASKKEIVEVNKKIYDHSDPEIDNIYVIGREESLAAFEKVYARLGTKFDNYFFEGKEGRNGEAVVRAGLAKGIFEESQGAIIFPGEKFGLHTRVFINSQGLPTYEAKELGLNTEKFKLYPDLKQSVIITGNEINDYFKVLLKVISLVDANIASKTKHIGHGMMRVSSGKMSSRKGNIVSAESLIGDIRELVMGKIADRHFTPAEADEISDIIAIGAIKYSILRSSPGSDIVYDRESSISFEGDSGPYLQYATVRARSILAKGAEEGLKPADKNAKVVPQKVSELERLLGRFPDLLERARYEYAPQTIASYLITLAGAFNSFYASQIILNKESELSGYYLALTKAFVTTMTNGLWVLGIKVPAKM